MKIKFILIITVIILTFIYIRAFTTLFKTPTVGFYKTKLEEKPIIIELLESKDGLNKKFEIIQYDEELDLRTQIISKPADILITEFINLDENWKDILEPIGEDIIPVFPHSTRGITTKNSSLLLPLQLDHVEFLYNKRRFSNNILTNGLIFNFSDLENQLLSLVSKNHYPLMVAGKDRQSLMDVLSILTLSLTGIDGYKKLESLLETETSIEIILQTELAEKIKFNNILNKLIIWKKRGILHPEWLRLGKKDVVSFLDNNLTSATIIRLSTHRTLETSILQKYSGTPFPFSSKDKRATGIITPMYSLALNKNSAFYKKLSKILPLFYTNDNQKKLTFFSGLAPVTSTSQTLDKQATDVRLWAAATQELFVPLVFNTDQITGIRNFINSEK